MGLNPVERRAELEDAVPALDTCDTGKLYFAGLKWPFARRISPSFFSQPSASSSSPTVAFCLARTRGE
jgi:hypothetical protein